MSKGSRSPSLVGISRQQSINEDIFEQGDHPLLTLLIRALYSLFETNEDLNPRKPIIHLMDAISSIYDSSLEMKREIICQIEKYRD